MTYPDTDSRMEFNFEGQFLGFVSHDGTLKYMRLRVLSEEMQIKLPKAVRLAAGGLFQSGELIQVTGIGKLDRQTHELKLKATQITSLTEQNTQILPTTSSSQEALAIHPSKINSKNKIKVLICQKSGCLKKGGKGLGEALEKILSDRGLKQYVTIERTSCLKRCSSAPNVVIMPGNHRYTEVRPKTMPQIADAIAQRLAPHGSPHGSPL